MSAGLSPGPTWTTLRESANTPSVMRSSDDDGDDELEVEHELTETPLHKRKAQYSPSHALRANKFPRLGLGEPSSTDRGAQGMESDDDEVTGRSSARPSVNASRTLSTRAIGNFTSSKSAVFGSSSSDEFGGTLTQVIRQANTMERLDAEKKDKGTGARRNPRRDGPVTTHRVVARKHVNGRPRVSTGSLLHRAQKSNNPDSPARTRVRPKRKAVVVNRNASLAHFRSLDTARRRSNPEVIELTDSDGRRSPHGTGAVLGNSAAMSNYSEDPIIISSGSEGNSRRSRARVRRRSAPTPYSAKKFHSMVPRCDPDIITILDSDDDGPVATFSVIPNNRQPTATAPSVGTTVVGTQPKGSSERQSISAPELGSSVITEDAANPDPGGSIPGDDMDVGSRPTPPAFPEPSSPRTCSTPTSPGQPYINATRECAPVPVSPLTGMATVDRAFGNIDLDFDNADDDIADTGLDMSVDRRNPTEPCEEWHDAKDLQVNTDVAAEEPGRNENRRETLQNSPGSKMIARSSINPSDKVETASCDASVPLQSSTQAQSSMLFSNTTSGQILGATSEQALKVPSISKEFVLPDVSSYSVRFNRPESSQSSFFSRAFGPSTSGQPATIPLHSKKITIEQTAPCNGAFIEAQVPKPDMGAFLSVAKLAKEHPGAGDPSQTSTSTPAALSEPSAQNPSGPLTSEVNMLTTVLEMEVPLSTGVLSVRSKNSILPSWKQYPSHSAQHSVTQSPVESPKPPLRSTSAAPAEQSLSTPSCPLIPLPCRPPPLSNTSLVDTFNQIRRDHLQAKVARQKSKEPAFQSEKKLEQTASQLLVSNEVEPPSTPSQSQVSRESQFRPQSPRISRESPSLTPLRSLPHDKRPSSGSIPSLSEPMTNSASRSVSESSNSTGSTTMEPSPHLLVDVPNLATTTTATSTSIVTPHSASPVFPRRVPASFEEFISKSPATQRSPLTQMRRDGPSPSQRSHRRSIGVPFERFIVKTPRRRNGTLAPGESDLRASSSSAAHGASVCSSSQFHDVHGEAVEGSHWPRNHGSQNDCVVDDQTSVEVQTDHPHTGFDADQLLELADVHLEPDEPETHPPSKGYPGPLTKSDILTTDVEMAAVAEGDLVDLTLPTGEPDSVAAHRDSLIPDHQTSAATPDSDDPSIAPVDTRVDIRVNPAVGRVSHSSQETMPEDNHLLVGSRSTVLPKAVSRHSLRRRSSHHHSLSRSQSSAEPLLMDTVATTHAIKQQEQPLPIGAVEYIGGYPIVTWQSFSASQRLLPPKYHRAKDLPHSLQDRMNALPKSYRNSEFARMVFEEIVLEAMDDEPDAPPIKIYDNGIGQEMTPPWEFVYTNKMWFGEGVPPPDVRNLVSCGCRGKCDPKSKTCACAKRQLQWLEPYIREGLFPATWPGSPFVYDSKGVLQREGCPIFECNQFCDCDEDCPNRVVQNGRMWPVNIVRTERKGWGVFAGPKRIPRGSYVGIYTGELLTEQEGEARGLVYNVFGRTYLFTIDFHHLKLGLKDEDDYENMYTVDAYHAGNFTRFLNHSCDPNCEITACYINDADINKPLLAVFTIRDIEPWEELCFSYYGDTEAKRESLAEQQANGKLTTRDDAVYVACSCGSANCIGKLF